MWKYFVAVAIVTVLAGNASSLPIEGRVVNGTDSSIEKYPFMVSLRSASGSHSCGSSIISPRFILTAAHCVFGKAVGSISLQYASTLLDSKTENLATVKKIIVHENYAPANNYANDIALLELNGELVFNGKTIDAVTLPEQGFETSQDQEGSPGVLAGWGYDQTGGSVMKNLQEVDLKIYSDAECNSRHDGITTTDQICGGVDEGGKGQCSGDSGGPLLLNGEVQVGIVSWSRKPCTIYPYPGVYTKVSHYINWIRQNMY